MLGKGVGSGARVAVLLLAGRKMRRVSGELCRLPSQRKAGDWGVFVRRHATRGIASGLAQEESLCVFA
jgi:hypothetical protein